MLAAFSANWRDAESLRRRRCHIATIQGTMLLGVATPGRQRGVIRWNPTNRRAVPDDFRSARSAAEWERFCHSSFQCECRAASATWRQTDRRKEKGGSQQRWGSAETKRDNPLSPNEAIRKGWKPENNTEAIRSANKERKPAVSAASQRFVWILLRGDNGEPVVREPRALIRPQQRSPVLFHLTQQKPSESLVLFHCHIKSQLHFHQTTISPPLMQGWRWTPV